MSKLNPFKANFEYSQSGYFKDYFEFKFDSKYIEVLQITKDEITFSAIDSEVQTVSLNDSLILKRH